MKKKEWLCFVSLSTSTATTVASHASSSPSHDSLRSTTAWRGGETEANAPDSNHSSTYEPKDSHHQKKKKSKKKTPSASSSTATNTTSNASSSASSTRQQHLLQDILKQDDYYQILGLTRQDGLHPDADAKIQKAYRRRAVVTHPDKTQGDRRAFDKVAEAYQVLSDPEQRQLYNRYGKAGLQQQQQGNMPYDIFQQFFNQARPFNNHHPINRTTRYQITLTLEELYHGITKTILVPPPNASPFHETHYHAKHVSVHIPPGTEAGHVVLCSGEIDFVPDATPADLVLVVQQQRHDVFTRKHYDLAMSLSISWSEALGGFQRRIRHLNGKEIPIAVAGSIQSGDIYRLRGYGMPKTGTEFGDLYIEFEVLLPQHRNQLTGEEYKELKRLVHKMEGTKPAHIKDTLELTQAKRSEFGVASGIPPDDTRHRYEEEQDEPHPFFYHAQGTNPFFGMRQGPMYEEDSNVQCRQM
ncbi:DnaJ homolog subfamily B member 5 [Fistulifera solaris]|uniref:DnaJ homolog subfamily B member 5 n=1 Tax=Fistulifera solaris TaxID=1519565 RepID=A0A1Z5JD45_FISSO|nr:DnaJ homolog subfamily B member 5 [Fistulifera solaris]|eukprot:GAX11688.1 DnaJ homolog subfamily B member 5 [Fistulifera solaris]